MQSSDIPSKSARVFAQSATGPYVRAVPQTTVDPAAASFDIGFPPQTFTDEGAGGTPPDGRDFNGILNHLSGWVRWLMAGGPVRYDSAFQTAVGGYPLGALVQSVATPGIIWRSTTDNNVTNPDTGGAGWVSLFAGVDRLVTQSLVDNNGYRIYESGFKQAWGFSASTLAAGASDTVTFAAFMPSGMAFSSWQRVTLGPGIAGSGTNYAAIGITNTTLSSFTVRNGGTVPTSYQWTTLGV